MMKPFICEAMMRRPSWESRNEGVHERINFDDTIWGFDLAGGAYYDAALRVTSVKKNSRAHLAGIRPGDVLIRINDVDTSTLTLDEAHDIILTSGIHIKLTVTSPDDEETTYNVWEDPLDEEIEEVKLRPAPQVGKEVEPFKGVTTNSHWSLQWPWVSKRRVIYKESNCFLVPSSYEKKHPDKLIPEIVNNEKNLVLSGQ